ncbi:O-antigen ligase family protein [Arthrobacter roseus]|uniref:O-antigen ligase family protein n=1 Tax=Arthrobacter roseus TaxID=136274 RepID=UPI0019667100|nr:O-antigen ligase family protein [Arthrobacter roseus]MBM7848039.1 hypothetical protein [Arthrobacter roseus]
MSTGESRTPARLYVVWLLIVASLVSWRQGVFYDGGADLVVIAKAACQMTALYLAVRALLRSPVRQPMGGAVLLLIGAIIAISCVGALAAGDTGASWVLSVRVVLLTLTTAALIRTYPADLVIRALLTIMGGIGLLSATSGIGEWAAGGRLAGVVPPLSPNAIAMLCALPALACLHSILLGRMRLRTTVAFALLTLILLATGSRTALAATLVASLMVFLHMRRLKVSVAVWLITLAPVLFAVLMFSNVVQDLAIRQDGASISTLNSRTIAWSAVLNTPGDTWQWWIGAGLAVKTVAVKGQYWEEQVLDSSWISMLAQSGALGASLLVLLCLLVVLRSLGARDLRSLTTPILVFVLARSVLENGLIGDNVMFVVFLTVALAVERPPAARYGLGTHEDSQLAAHSEPAASGRLGPWAETDMSYREKAPR